MVLDSYEPRAVFKHFEAISQIPRGSGNEKAVSDFIAEFAKDFEIIQDEWHNLIIKKPATVGYEDKEPVILQAHLDMVCEKNTDTSHDFTRDPLDLYVDGDFIKARGTTLGADNGIGVAFCMALLQESTNHPPLEIVLTSEEETGMDGAKNLDMSVFKGRRMINLDSTDDTRFTMGCAAGTEIKYVIPAERTSPASGETAYKISVKGLHGGHSGEDINKERGNSLKILGLLLAALGDGLRISEISGGMKVNAIPREATAVVFVSDRAASEASLEKCRSDLKEQNSVADPDLCIEWETVGSTGPALTPECSGKVVSLLLLTPSGVLARSLELEELVNASCNLGVAETSEKYVEILAMCRGASEFYNRQIEVQLVTLAKLVGVEVSFAQRSPAWAYNPASKLLKTALEAYTPVFNREPFVTASHGGLECGLFAEKISGLDIISLGPTNLDLHTPDERLSISSTARFWEFLQAFLKSL
ncbi:MAG: beta-Ala-His dipeptidase [Defluviitaleaceae bacterium]|nr:beta-Ala-His dipeptidase [Defluviitaleaceae bacterium]